MPQQVQLKYIQFGWTTIIMPKNPTEAAIQPFISILSPKIIRARGIKNSTLEKEIVVAWASGIFDIA